MKRGVELAIITSVPDLPEIETVLDRDHHSAGDGL